MESSVHLLGEDVDQIAGCFTQEDDGELVLVVGGAVLDGAGVWDELGEGLKGDVLGVLCVHVIGLLEAL